MMHILPAPIFLQSLRLSYQMTRARWIPFCFELFDEMFLPISVQIPWKEKNNLYTDMNYLGIYSFNFIFLNIRKTWIIFFIFTFLSFKEYFLFFQSFFFKHFSITEWPPNNPSNSRSLYNNYTLKSKSPKMYILWNGCIIHHDKRFTCKDYDCFFFYSIFDMLTVICFARSCVVQLILPFLSWKLHRLYMLIYLFFSQ